MGHRLSEWTGYGPTLEQDIALSNIALDLIGQSRNFYQYAAEIINSTTENSETEIKTRSATEDTLAYLRHPEEFKNIILAELPNGDWAHTIVKLFLFSAYQFFLYEQLAKSADKQLSAIAAKSIKEVTYHLRWSSEWVIRLGDGTAESNNRMMTALDNLWDYTAEMFVPADYEIAYHSANIGMEPGALKNEWDKKIKNIFSEATLTIPVQKRIENKGKQGMHTSHLISILADMQFLQRTFPDCEW